MEDLPRDISPTTAKVGRSVEPGATFLDRIGVDDSSAALQPCEGVAEYRFQGWSMVDSDVVVMVEVHGVGGI